MIHNYDVHDVITVYEPLHLFNSIDSMVINNTVLQFELNNIGWLE